ncbi:MAG: Gfo/Idh/MocA family oxidoreductase [bacterium]|nr:Gfo/Idh/MocA family oxidoreductase [bacterium]
MSKQRKQSRANFKAVIIGAGRIASQFDSPKSGGVLTHAHAFDRHPRVDLMGMFDTNKGVARREAKKWGCQAYDDLDTMMKTVQPEIVSICTPDSSHFGILLKIAPYRPRIVICEKPVTLHVADTRKIVRLYRHLGIPVVVNYPRRFDRAVQEIQHAITTGEYGKVLCASGTYTKGILHSGSHMIDLCRFLFGEARSVVTTLAVADYSPSDTNISGCLEFELCKQFHLMVGDERKYSLFELDILFERCRIRLIDSGFYISVQDVGKDHRYAGYQCLSKPVSKRTSLNRAMLALVDNVVHYLSHGQLLIGRVEDAAKTQRVCELLLTGKKFRKHYV